MSVGIALATSGMLHFLSKMEMFKSFGTLPENIAKSAKNVPNFLTKAVAIQSATTALGAVMHNQARRFVDEEEIAAEAAEIFDRISVDQQEQLFRIFATDHINGNMKLQRGLYDRITQIVSKYQKKYHDDGTTFGVGVGTNLAGYVAGGMSAFGNMIGWGSVIDATTKFALGYSKNQGAMRGIEKKMREAINEVSSRAISKEEITARNIDSEAMMTMHLLRLKEHFSYSVSRSIKAVQLNEMISPWTSFAASELGNAWGGKLGDYINDRREAEQLAFEQASEARRVAESSNEANLANDNVPEKSPKKATTKAKTAVAARPRHKDQSTSIQEKAKRKTLAIDSLLGQEQMASFTEAKKMIDDVGKSASEKQAAKAYVNQLETTVNKARSGDQTALKTVARKLDHFITEYPWAGNAFTVLKIGCAALAGVAGIVTVVANEVKGQIIGKVAASAIESAITKAAGKIREFDTSLTEREAIVLATSLLAASSFVADSKSMLKGMKSILKKADFNGGLAFAHVGAGGGSKNTRFEVDTPGKRSNIFFSSSSNGGNMSNNVVYLYVKCYAQCSTR